MNPAKSSKALFLDRDGTLIYDRHYLSDPEKVELIPGVAAFLKKALTKGYHLFLFTNQSGVGRGLFTLEDVHKCHQRMWILMGLSASCFTEIKIATETPDQKPIYRKPSPRFIIEMIKKYKLVAKDCFMIGDSLNDLKAAINSGVHPLGVKTGGTFTAETNLFISKYKIPVFEALPDSEESIFYNIKP